MSNSKMLPGIKTVEFISAAEATLTPKRVLAPGDKITVIGNFKKFTLSGLASCSHTNERTSNGIIYTTKVLGTVIEDDDMDNGQQNELIQKLHSYRMTDIYNNKYLIGSDRYNPYPEIVFSPSNESSPAGKRAINFEITWIATLPPIELVAL